MKIDLQRYSGILPLSYNSLLFQWSCGSWNRLSLTVFLLQFNLILLLCLCPFWSVPILPQISILQILMYFRFLYTVVIEVYEVFFHLWSISFFISWMIPFQILSILSKIVFSVPLFYNFMDAYYVYVSLCIHLWKFYSKDLPFYVQGL